MNPKPPETSDWSVLQALQRWLSVERTARPQQSPEQNPEAERALRALFALWPLPAVPGTLVPRVMKALAARGAFVRPRSAFASARVRWAVAAGYLLAAVCGLAVAIQVRQWAPTSLVRTVGAGAGEAWAGVTLLWGRLTTVAEVTGTVVTTPPVLMMLLVGTLLALAACRWLYTLTGAAFPGADLAAGGGSHAV